MLSCKSYLKRQRLNIGHIQVDMLLASKTMDEADFAQLRTEAQQAADDEFLQEADQYFQDTAASPIGLARASQRGCQSASAGNSRME